MISYTLQDIEKTLKDIPHSTEGNTKEVRFRQVKPIDSATENSLVWCSPNQENPSELIRQTAARVVVCGNQVELPEEVLKEKCIIRTQNPRYAFGKIANRLFREKTEYHIHSSACIHNQATIHERVYIGPHTYIGKCNIAEGCIIHGNSYLYDGVRIGKNVFVEPGCVLGSEGFGLSRDEEGRWERFPHIGSLVVEDHVEIGANSSIDRGALKDTFIGGGTKISKSVHISHNVTIGKNCIITGGALISGSVTIGDDVWIGPNASILNKIKIGNGAMIGIGAVVTQDVQEGHKAIGNRVLPK